MSRSTLARHRFTRTSAEGGGGGQQQQGGENQQQNNQQQQNQQGGADSGAGSGKPNAKDPETGEDLGFPADTPTKDMTPEQVGAYWRNQSKVQQKKNADLERQLAQRQNDSQNQQQNQQQQSTVDEKKIREDAQADAAEVSLRGILATKGKKKDEIDGLLGFVNFKRFLNEQGRVNAEAVLAYADQIVPAGSGGGGGFGQGRHENAQQDKAAAGKAEAERRFGNTQQQQSAQPRFGPLSRRSS